MAEHPNYKYVKNYDGANTTQVKLKLNYNTDADILEFLEQCGNKQGTIKKLIRDEIARSRGE